MPSSVMIPTLIKTSFKSLISFFHKLQWKVLKKRFLSHLQIDFLSVSCDILYHVNICHNRGFVVFDNIQVHGVQYSDKQIVLYLAIWIKIV